MSLIVIIVRNGPRNKFSRLYTSHASVKNKERIKYPQRGGRNLRDRYLVLEKSLRGKELLTRARDHQQDITAANTSPRPPPAINASKHQTFRGFVVPIEPSPPDSDECCMSGCAVCVYDLYEESLATHNESVEKLRASLRSLNIPENEWPKSIQTRMGVESQVQPNVSTRVAMSAFDELERRLKEKQQQRTLQNSSQSIPGS